MRCRLGRELVRPVGLAGFVTMIAVACAEVGLPVDVDSPLWLRWCLNESHLLLLACALVIVESVTRRLPESHAIRRINRRGTLYLSPFGQVVFRGVWYSTLFVQTAVLAYLVLIAVHAIERAQPIMGLAVSPAERASAATQGEKNALLAIAVDQQDAGRVRMLLRRGADPNTPCAAAYLLRSGTRSRMNSPMSILEQAAVNGDLAVGSLLLEAGADPNRKGEQSPLIEAVCSERMVPMMRLLMRHGATPNTP